MRFATKAIHQGQSPDSATGAIMTPIYQTSTFAQESIGVHKGFEYARTHNPTRKALEECLSSLENGKYGLAFSSGMAATSCITGLLKSGDHVILGEDVYGGTYRLFNSVLSNYNIEFTSLDSRDLSAVKKAIKPNTKLLWIETPTNPLLRLADIKALSEIARNSNIITTVDNTFASPYFQTPLDLGADIVMHSTTKYIGGHSDVVGGAVVTNDEKLYEKMKFLQNSVGAIPGPMDCFLTLRGLKTLKLRAQAHAQNAMAVAKFLLNQPLVEKVYYPGLPDHPQHELAKLQMRGFGGMVSFVLKGGFDAANTLASNTKIFTLAESLGGIESLICHPPSMTHGSIPQNDRISRGIVDGLLRFSVGIEEIEDLIEDLTQAFKILEQKSKVKI